ncbi:hypothetical protein Hanom_Chr17g01561401 [Helianthus anomalus]
MRCPFAGSNCQNILRKFQMEEMKRHEITFLLIGGLIVLVSKKLKIRKPNS